MPTHIWSIIHHVRGSRFVPFGLHYFFFFLFFIYTGIQDYQLNASLHRDPVGYRFSTMVWYII